MIRYIEVNGQVLPIIAMEETLQTDADIIEARKWLVEILTACLSDDKVKDSVSSVSLWFLIKLIEEMTIDSTEEEYKYAHADYTAVLIIYNSVFGCNEKPCTMLSAYKKNRISDLFRHFGAGTVRKVFAHINDNKEQLRGLKITVDLSYCVNPITFGYWHNKMLEKEEGGEV